MNVHILRYFELIFFNEQLIRYGAVVTYSIRLNPKMPGSYTSCRKRLAFRHFLYFIEAIVAYIVFGQSNLYLNETASPVSLPTTIDWLGLIENAGWKTNELAL